MSNNLEQYLIQNAAKILSPKMTILLVVCQNHRLKSICEINLLVLFTIYKHVYCSFIY